MRRCGPWHGDIASLRLGCPKPPSGTVVSCHQWQQAVRCPSSRRRSSHVLEGAGYAVRGLGTWGPFGWAAGPSQCLLDGGSREIPRGWKCSPATVLGVKLPWYPGKCTAGIWPFPFLTLTYLAGSSYNMATERGMSGLREQRRGKFIVFFPRPAWSKADTTRPSQHSFGCLVQRSFYPRRLRCRR